jgi:hypothetical protein
MRPEPKYDFQLYTLKEFKIIIHKPGERIPYIPVNYLFPKKRHRALLPGPEKGPKGIFVLMPFFDIISAAPPIIAPCKG